MVELKMFIRLKFAVCFCLLMQVLSGLSKSTPVERRISLRKCEEYKKLTYTESNVTGSSRKMKNYKCTTPTGLIAGGEAAKENEYPHMAHIGYWSGRERKYVCGGSLISEKFVLTSAHCMIIPDTQRKSPSFVRLNSISDDSRQKIYQDILNFTWHPNYTAEEPHNDIALVELKETVKFETGKLRPACLWTEAEMKNKTAAITGWGATGHAKSASKYLLKAKIDLIETNNCRPVFGNGDEKYYICAKDMRDSTIQNRTDTCQGDSGGPLQINQPDNQCQMHIIALTTKGNACGFKNSVGVYVKVSKFIDWIESIVWNEQ